MNPEQFAIELPYLVEAAAYVAFKNTACELDVAVKKLAENILGARWFTHKKKRSALPNFVKETLSKSVSKSMAECWSASVLLPFLAWLASKESDKESVEDKLDEEEWEKCRSVSEHVKNISLLDRWMHHCPAPCPKDIVYELREYMSILMELGCNQARRTVEETCRQIFAEVEEESFAQCASKEKKGVMVDRTIAGTAVVFKLFHLVRRAVYEYCRDSDEQLSHILSWTRETRDKENMDITVDGLYSLLAFLREAADFSEEKKELLSKLEAPLKRFSRHIARQASDLTESSAKVNNFVDIFTELAKQVLGRYQHANEVAEISRMLGFLFQAKKEMFQGPVEVLLPSRLEQVYPSTWHHWIAQNREEFTGKEKELSQICNLLQKRAGKVLVVGSIGMGKSCFVRQAAFRLRTTWPCQFVIDMSSSASQKASMLKMWRHCGQGSINIGREPEQLNLTLGEFFEQFPNLRFLLILENVYMLASADIFELAECERASTIIVTRHMKKDRALHKKRRELVQLTIYMSLFSNLDLATVLYKSFKCYFDWWTERLRTEGTCKDQESEEKIVSAWELASVGKNLTGHQIELRDLMYRASFLAQPTVPLLPSLLGKFPGAGENTEDFEETREKLQELEQAGIVHLEQDEMGREYVRMHGFVCQVVWTKLLMLPVDEPYSPLFQCVNAFYRFSYSVEDQSKTDLATHDAIACSAVILERSPLFGMLSGGPNVPNEIRRATFLLHGVLSHALARLCGPLSRSCVLTVAEACHLLTNSLKRIVYLQDRSAFWNICIDYTMLVTGYRFVTPMEQADRAYELLALALKASTLAGPKGAEFITESDSVTLAIMIARSVQDYEVELDWANIYLCFARGESKLPRQQVYISKQLGLLRFRQKRLDEAQKKLLVCYDETIDLFGENSAKYADVLRHLGEVYMHTGNLARARWCMSEGVGTLEKLGDGALDQGDQLCKLECLLGLGSVRLLARSAGKPCACREKFGPRPIFKIFSLDQIRVDQEKKEVRKRRASIYRTSPSDAVEHFLVSHVITSIVVIEFVISKNRRLGAISTTLNGHLLETVAWSSSLSSTSSSRNVKTAARSAGACRHGSSSEFNFGLMGLFPSSGWFVCCSFWSWSCSACPVCVHLDRRIDAGRGRLPCIIMEEQEAVVSLVLSGHNVFFQGGRRQSLGKSVVMRTLRNARSIAADDDDGKTFAATFYHCHWTGSRICHAHRSPSARERRSQ